MTAQQFKVQDGAHYLAEELTAQQAADLGCPGATHKLTGNHGHIVGTVTPTTGKPVRVAQAGWYSRTGLLATFTPAVTGEGLDSLRGWVTV